MSAISMLADNIINADLESSAQRKKLITHILVLLGIAAVLLAVIVLVLVVFGDNTRRSAPPPSTAYLPQNAIYALPSEPFPSKFDPNGVDWLHNISELELWTTSLAMAIAYAIQHPADTKTNGIVRAAAENFMTRFKMSLYSYHVVPWNETDYRPFSIYAMRALAWYLLMPKPKEKLLAIELILSIIKTPSHTFNVTAQHIPVLDSVFLAGPFVLAHYFKGSNMTNLAQMSELQAVYTYCSLDVVKTPGMKGRHLDNSLLARPGVIRYNEVWTLNDTLSRYFFAFDPNFRNGMPMGIIKSSYKFGFRAFVNQSIAPFNYATSLRAPVATRTELGVEVMPMARFLRFFTPKYSFFVRGHATHLAFYEQVGNVTNTAHYYSQYRGLFKNETNHDFLFPQVGFLTRLGVKQPVRIQEDLPLYPTAAECYVLKYQHYGMFYQRYRLPQFVGAGVEICERILIDAVTQKLNVEIGISNGEKTAVVYYMPPHNCQLSAINDVAQLLPCVVDAKSQGNFSMTYDFKTDFVVVPGSGNRPIAPDFNYVNGLEIKIEDGYAILYDQGKPQVLAPFQNDADETPIIEVNDRAFVFHGYESQNQYLLAK